jgi:hypothetical protein
LKTLRAKKRSWSLPSFVVGEKDHTNLFFWKKNQTTQSIYRSYFITAMETAGKQIDDEDLRELMKENGIGRQQELT